MRVLITGATGFAGIHVAQRFIDDGHEVVAIARDGEKAKSMPWYDRVEFVQADVYQDLEQILSTQKVPDIVTHLAWPGLPNYTQSFHLTENLPAELRFLRDIVDWGVTHIQVAGTCLEYGLQSGPLRESDSTFPTTPYGLAKDTVRKALKMLGDEREIVTQWVRLFYVHGKGQSKRSLLVQLQNAIDSNEKTFNMSEGSQLRDYLPMEEVAKCFVSLAKHTEVKGTVNCCSGKPVSVIDIVRDAIAKQKSSIALNRGYYSIPNYEPMAFWGVPETLQRLRELDQDG